MNEILPRQWLISNSNQLLMEAMCTEYMKTACRRHAEEYLSSHMGKPTICICENKDADQLCGYREADQPLCFHYSDSTISLLLKSEISRF